MYKIKSKESCEYHWAIDNGQFCSLNVVKRRVYSIWAKVGRRAAMPASGGSSLAGLENEGATVPFAKEILADETDEVVIAYRAIECRREDYNAFGEQLTKAGSMNGQASNFVLLVLYCAILLVGLFIADVILVLPVRLFK